MATRLIVLVHDIDDYSERLSNEFYNYEGTLDEFVGIIRKDYPKALCEEFNEEPEGDIVEQTDRYIMTDEQHNMGETMRIYEIVEG